VDVRLILFDKEYDKLHAAVGTHGIVFLGLAIGEYLASRTAGMPIDFQIQRATQANAQHSGGRNALGMRKLNSYVGDCDMPAQEPTHD
jgi:hypothetical protein